VACAPENHDQLKIMRSPSPTDPAMPGLFLFDDKQLSETK
jgi:hypothetical protein